MQPSSRPPSHLGVRPTLGEETDDDADDEDDEGEDDGEVQEVDLVEDGRPLLLLPARRLLVVQVHDHAGPAHRQPRHQAPERPLQRQSTSQSMGQSTSQIISQPVS